MLLKGLGLLLLQHLDHQVPQYSVSLLRFAIPAQTTQQHSQDFHLITTDNKTKNVKATQSVIKLKHRTFAKLQSNITDTLFNNLYFLMIYQILLLG